ncbi:hypothetical protein [Streptomyces sp. NPDC059009]
MNDDLVAYLDRDILVTLWPILRQFVGRAVRSVWEGAFPELNSLGVAGG